MEREGCTLVHRPVYIPFHPILINTDRALVRQHATQPELDLDERSDTEGPSAGTIRGLTGVKIPITQLMRMRQLTLGWEQSKFAVNCRLDLQRAHTVLAACVKTLIGNKVGEQ